MAEMDEYAEKIADIEKRIVRLKILRDAQTPDSLNAGHFQRQIDDLTNSLISWEDNAPRLREVDAGQDKALTALMTAEQYVRYAGTGWNQGARWFAFVGGIAVLASLVASLAAWVPVLGGVLVLAAGGCVYGGIRAHINAEDVRDARETDLADYNRMKTQLLPGEAP
ncbi:hypothetical protein [Amycolatopsis sp.]|uniref:hypothetical protein n=1 Tax=Amycolatopsis sp. TaxID=37632 RepID=UPI002623F19F|nr:hypothetical protein [Amycolatopsis sp.]